MLDHFSKDLSKEEIEKALEQLNDFLQKKGRYGEILIAGGAALTLAFNARNATRDVDAIFEPSEVMREGIHVVAENLSLNEDWLNDGVKGFLKSNMHTNVYKEYSNLLVSTVDAKGLLAMKLTSARMSQQSMDMSDSIFLMNILNIRDEQELYSIVEEYSSPEQQTPASFYFIQAAFELYQQEYLQNQKKEEIEDFTF